MGCGMRVWNDLTVTQLERWPRERRERDAGVPAAAGVHGPPGADRRRDPQRWGADRHGFGVRPPRVGWGADVRYWGGGSTVNSPSFAGGRVDRWQNGRAWNCFPPGSNFRAR